MTLLAVACSSGSEVETTGDTDTTVATETSEAPETADDGDGNEGLVETESEAMGEDDTDPTGGTTELDAETTDPDSETSGGDVAESTSIDDAELAAALEAGQDDALKLPFLYVTAEQDCDGCAETVSLYYIPGPEKASILVLGGAFVDGEQVDANEVDPILAGGDPRLVAEELAAAAASSDVAYSIDQVSGLVTGWTVDGNTVTLRCLQVDTRPIDLRSEVCRDSLIG